MEPAWSSQHLSDPHAAVDKARRVREMFAAIAPSYDLNNRVHSLWRDQAWRRAAVRTAQVQPMDVVLDVACGTGDLSLAFAATKPAKVIGMDFTHPMLQIAQQKPGHRAQDSPAPTYHAADALRLPVADASVNVVSIAFGIRNVSSPAAAMREFYRVLKPGGRAIILEFSLPTNPAVRAMYEFYFHQVLPRTASLIARDRSGAYRYLPRSVCTFLSRTQMIDLLRGTGFRDIRAQALTFGIAVVYRGVKP